jgi:hypothetical protein
MLDQVSSLATPIGRADKTAEEIKRSNQGKMAAATQVQSGENLKPLFKQLRSRVGAHLMRWYGS